MYARIWTKYQPVIKILLKRSAGGEQSLDLNNSDFEKAGATRKAGYKFTIEFSKGRVDNVISSSNIAKGLASVLLEDKMIKDMFTQNDYRISMNGKFQLAIKLMSNLPLETKLPETDEVVEEEVVVAEEIVSEEITAPDTTEVD